MIPCIFGRSLGMPPNRNEKKKEKKKQEKKAELLVYENLEEKVYKV